MPGRFSERVVLSFFLPRLGKKYILILRSLVHSLLSVLRVVVSCAFLFHVLIWLGFTSRLKNDKVNTISTMNQNYYRFVFYHFSYKQFLYSLVLGFLDSTGNSPPLFIERHNSCKSNRGFCFSPGISQLSSFVIVSSIISTGSSMAIIMSISISSFS